MRVSELIIIGYIFASLSGGVFSGLNRLPEFFFTCFEMSFWCEKFGLSYIAAIWTRNNWKQPIILSVKAGFAEQHACNMLSISPAHQAVVELPREALHSPPFSYSLSPLRPSASFATGSPGPFLVRFARWTPPPRPTGNADLSTVIHAWSGFALNTLGGISAKRALANSVSRTSPQRDAISQGRATARQQRPS